MKTYKEFLNHKKESKRREKEIEIFKKQVHRLFSKVFKKTFANLDEAFKNASVKQKLSWCYEVKNFKIKDFGEVDINIHDTDYSFTIVIYDVDKVKSFIKNNTDYFGHVISESDLSCILDHHVHSYYAYTNSFYYDTLYRFPDYLLNKYIFLLRSSYNNIIDYLKYNS